MNVSKEFNRGIYPDVARTLKADDASCVAFEIPISVSFDNGIMGGVQVANTIMARDYKGIGNREGKTVVAYAIGNVNPSGNGMNGEVYSSKGVSPAITTNKGEGTKIAVPLVFGIDKNANGEEREIANTLTAREDRGVSNQKQTGTAVAYSVPLDVSVKIREAVKKGYTEAHIGDSINLAFPDSKLRRGRVGGGRGSNVGHSMQSGGNTDDTGEYP